MKRMLLLILMLISFSSISFVSVSASEIVETTSTVSEFDISADDGGLTYYQEEVLQRLVNLEEIQLQIIQFLIFLFVVVVLYVIFRSFIVF